MTSISALSSARTPSDLAHALLSVRQEVSSLHDALEKAREQIGQPTADEVVEAVTDAIAAFDTALEQAITLSMTSPMPVKSVA